MDTGTFRFWLPLQKSEELVKGERKRIVQGVASTEHPDLQREEVIQKGMDFAPYLNEGFINWDHLKGPENLLGEPFREDGARIIAYKGKPALFTKGWLYEGIQRSDAVWDLMQVLEKSGSDRKLGWSVEGGILARLGKKIVNSVVRHMAITYKPVNTLTFAEFAKSMCCGRCNPESSNYDPEYNQCQNKEIAKAIRSDEGWAVTCYLQDGGIDVQQYETEDMAIDRANKANKKPDIRYVAVGKVLQKSMTLMGTTPIHLQNLAGVDNVTPQSMQALDVDLTSVLWGDCNHNCFDHSGRFYGGRTGALEHMVKCRGVKAENAKDFLIKAYSSGLFL
ncbi:MAG: hypothetical protein ACYCX4_01690 [Bacillota bacterium]